MHTKEDMTQHVSRPGIVYRMLLVALAAALLSAVALIPQVARAQVAGAAVGPVDANVHPFPSYYQDARGLQVAPCLDRSAQCGLLQEIGEPPPLPSDGPVSFPDNFPDEFPYWEAEAAVEHGAGTVDLIMGVSATFVNTTTGEHGTALNGDLPVVESGILIKGDGLKPNASYRITHPYGKVRVTTDNVGRFKNIDDAGCEIEFVGQTCDFSAVLDSPIFGGLLRWNPNVAPAAPTFETPDGTTVRYLGDGHVAHTVVGSPVRDAANKPQNYLKVEQLRKGKAPITERTNQFFVTGKVFAG